MFELIFSLRKYFPRKDCGFAQIHIISIHIAILVPFCFIELYSYTEENDFQENVLSFEVMLVEYNKDGKDFVQICMKCVMRCAIWYHLYNLKNMKNTNGGVLILVKLQLTFDVLRNLTKL